MLYRSLKICNNGNSFHIYVKSIKSNLVKNSYPPFLISKIIKKYLDHKISSNKKELKDTYDKISLTKCLLYRSLKICNNGNSFHIYVKSIKSNLVKNSYPPFLISKIIKKYLNHKISSNKKELKDTYDVDYFKLPYISNLSRHIENKISKLRK